MTTDRNAAAEFWRKEFIEALIIANGLKVRWGRDPGDPQVASLFMRHEALRAKHQNGVVPDTISNQDEQQAEVNAAAVALRRLEKASLEAIRSLSALNTLLSAEERAKVDDVIAGLRNTLSGIDDESLRQQQAALSVRAAFKR